MALKRHFSDREEDAGSEIPRRESKRQPVFATVVRDVMKGLSLHEFMMKFEPFLRSVVREEVEHKIQLFHHSSPRSTLNQFDSSKARDWQLHFDDKFPSTLFTGSRIESEDSKLIKIVVRDSISKKIITSGSLSSIKAEIVVLDGDFGADDQEDWTERDFNGKVVHQREGKRPLVTGELVITMRNGVGYIGDVSFTDNSSWIRSQRFRLGARIVQSTSTDVRVREARSEAFRVKDHRGESYKKHHPPYLGDETWRLEKIAKDGAFHKRLTGKGITTVKDFLRLYYVDPSSLRNILGGGISNKTWETIIEHATACVLDDKLYMYYRDAERVGLVFNSIFKVVGATFDGPNLQSLDKLNIFQMGLVENLKGRAYKNLDDLIPLDESSVFGPAMLPSSLLADPFSSPSSSLQHVNFPGLHQDLLEMQRASNHTTTSPPFSYNAQDGGSQFEVSGEQYCHPMQVSTPTSGNSLMATDSFLGPYGGGNSWAPSGSPGPLMQIGHLTADDNPQVEASIWQGNGFFLAPPSNEAVGILSSNFGIRISGNGKPKARWCMIRAALKWGISVRRDVAAKKFLALSPKFLDYSF